MATTEDALRRLLEAHQTQYKTIEKATLAKAEAVWRASPSYRDADIAVLIQKLLPILQGSMIRVAENEALLISRFLTAETETKVKAVKVDKPAIHGRVYAWEEYLRGPALAVYGDLAAGRPFSDAVNRGARTLGGIVQHSLAEARAGQTEASYRSSGVTGYRRVKSGTACEFCSRVIGSGQQVYRVSSGLRPLHKHCDCGYRAVGSDKVQKMNPAEIARADKRAQADKVLAAKRDTETKTAYKKQALQKAEAHADSVRERWAGIESLPKNERAVGRKQIGIAEQRVIYARRALAA